jgi:hypothetical protein
VGSDSSSSNICSRLSPLFLFAVCNSSKWASESSACCCIDSSISNISNCYNPGLIWRAIGCNAFWTAVCCMFCFIVLEFKILTSKKVSSSNLVICGVFLDRVAIRLGCLIVSVGFIIAYWINSSYVGFLW